MRTRRIQLRTACTLLTGVTLSLALLPGCSYFGATSSSSKMNVAAESKKRTPGPTKVMVDGPALALGQPEQDTALRQAFMTRFTGIVKEGRTEAARIWVERYPDFALDILRDSVSEAPVAGAEQLAQLHDELCGANSNGGWTAVLAAQAKHSQAFAAYSEGRGQVMKSLRSGEFAEACTVNLPQLAEATGQTLLSIDAWQLVGVSRMLADQPEQAVHSLEKGIEIAQSVSPHQTAYMLLLLSETRRRANDPQGAVQAWSDAVTLAGQLLSQSKPIADPTLWDRAMYLQPVGTPWPAAVSSSLATLRQSSNMPHCLQGAAPIIKATAHNSTPQATSAALWSCIGFWRMERGEPQGALVAFKRAESAGIAEASDWTRLGQARALIAMEKGPGATAILMQLASRKDRKPTTLAAMAQLGSIKVAEGATNQGITLLRTALDEKDAADWPERGRAEADLGLAYLLVSDEPHGVQWLEKSQARFKSQGDLESLSQCLWNQARYYEQTKNKTKMAELQAQWEQMQL